MDAKELRIGNWIFSCEDYIQVTGIEHNAAGWRIYHTYGWSLLGEDCPCGIPLTPEILEMAGFYVIPKYNFEYPVLNITESGSVKLCTNGAEDKKYLFLDGLKTPCEYLHQLQNLYFSLTGQELQINLNKQIQ